MNRWIYLVLFILCIVGGYLFMRESTPPPATPEASVAGENLPTETHREPSAPGTDAAPSGTGGGPLGGEIVPLGLAPKPDVKNPLPLSTDPLNSGNFEPPPPPPPNAAQSFEDQPPPPPSYADPTVPDEEFVPPPPPAAEEEF